jgi:hypothetical protein
MMVDARPPGSQPRSFPVGLSALNCLRSCTVSVMDRVTGRVVGWSIPDGRPRVASHRRDRSLTGLRHNWCIWCIWHGGVGLGIVGGVVGRVVLLASAHVSNLEVVPTLRVKDRLTPTRQASVDVMSTMKGDVVQSGAGGARTRDLRISDPSILTVPVAACFSLCDNQIDHLETPIGTGQFRSVPGHWR